MRTVINAEEKQKKDWQARKHFSVRVNLFFFCTFALFSVLIFRLALLQFVESKTYQQAQNDRATRDVTIAPIRGNIFDANGFPIAYTVSAESLFYRIIPGEKKDDYIRTAKQLESIFAQYGDPNAGKLSAADIIKLMDVGIDLDGKKTKDPSYSFMPRRIKTNLSKKEIAYLAEHRDELNGVEISEESTRVYNRIDDKESIASQLVGYLRPYNTAANQKADYLQVYRNNPNGEYLNDEYVGFDGLEFMYQDELRGKNGSKTYPVNSRGQIVGKEQVTPPEKGHNLILTINKDVQLAAQQAIADQIKAMHDAPDGSFPALGKQAVSGYAVAMEVNTGKIVAMANYPDYDPNIWTGGISEDQLNEIQYRYTNGTIRERLADVPPKQVGKHPSSLVYLGSTMKPLTILLGLNEGLITPNSTYDDPGYFTFGRGAGSTIHDDDGRPMGLLTPVTALQFSSNVFMSAMVGDPLYKSPKYKGDDALKVWDSYMDQFGLGVLTGSGLPGESPGLKDYLVTAKKESLQSALVFASWGQQAKYTTLQLAQYASMLANHGIRYKPQFVNEITTYDGTPLQTFKPEVLNKVTVPDTYWDVLKKGMANVHVEGGLADAPYKVERKTGTSQENIGGQLLENAVLICYAPADNPKLAIAVVVPEGGYGAWGAAPIAKKIFDAYDQVYGLDGPPKGAAGTTTAATGASQ